MKLKLHEIKDPVTLQFSEREPWIKQIFSGLKIKNQGPIHVHLKVSMHKGDIFFDGHLVLTFVLNCSRCVKEMHYSIDEFFSPVYIHGREPRMVEGQVDRQELDVTYFQGDEIDLEEVLREQILLSLPIQPLCKESCKGLCPQCGADLNIKNCDCKKEVIQSTFGKLCSFKVKK